MKTNKRNLLLTLILAVLCVCTAFVFAGCSKSIVTPPQPEPEHEHSFTVWQHSGPEHWRECPVDGATTEKSPHRFVDGKCECGLVDTREFGTVTGKVTLSGGKNSTDYSDVTVDFGDSDTIVSVDKSGNFTATHVTVGKAYDITASKSGYSSYTAAVILQSKDETVSLAKPFALVYQRFESWQNKNTFNFDMTQMNDVNAPYIRSVANGDLGLITRESFDDIAISVNFTKLKDSGDDYPQKGLLVKFEGDNYMMLRIHNNKSLRWDGAVWNQSSIDGKYDEFYQLTDDQKRKLETEEGIKLTLVRSGNMLYIFLDDSIILNGTRILAGDFADDKVRVGFWEFAPKAGKVWKFGVKEDISDYNKKIPSYNAPTVTAANGKVSFDKASYKYGETATVTLKPDNGYILFDFKVYGKSALDGVANNVYSFTVIGDITVDATFVDYELKDVALTVKGLKIKDEVAFNGEVTLTNTANKDDIHTVTLVNGKATAKGLITPATYKVVYSDENYGVGSITLDKGDTTASVTLQYMRFESWQNGNLGRYDLSQMNGKEIVRTVTEGDLGLMTRDKYDNVAISVWLKKPNSADSLPNKGLVIKFNGDNYMILRIHNNELLRWDAAVWGQTTIENRETKVCDLTVGHKQKLDSEDGIKVTLVRSGNMLYTYLEDEFIPEGTKALAKEFADDKVQVGFWEFSPKAGKTWKFEIKTDITEYDNKIPTFSAPSVTAANGKVVFDKASYKYGEIATVTLTPDAGHIMGSLTVNGKLVSTEVVKNAYSFSVVKEINASATFIPSGNLDSVTFNLSPAANANGMVIILYRDGETDIVGTVANNSFTATDVKPGTWHAKTTQYGMELALKDVYVGANTVTIDTSGAFKTEDAVNIGSEKTHASGEGDMFYAIPVNITGDAYFAMKVKSPTVTSNMANDSARFGLHMKYGSKELSVTFVIKGGNWVIQTCSAVYEQRIVTYDLRDAMKTNGIYLVVRRESANGYVHVYLGTSIESLIELDPFTSEGITEVTKTALTEFGIDFRSGNYEATASDLLFGTTMSAALGSSTPVVVTGDGDVMSGSTKQGAIAVSAANVYDDVTVTVTTEPGFKLTGLTVNGAAVALDKLTVVSSGTYTYTLAFYNKSTFNVSATFVDYQLQNVAITVNGLKIKETVKLKGEITLINTLDENDTHKETLANGAVTVNDLVTPGTYKVVSPDANYYDGTLTLAKGDTTATVTLQYKRFEAWANGASDRYDLSHINGDNTFVHVNTLGDLGVITRDGYANVAVSAWMTTNNRDTQKGLVVKFADGKHMILRIHNNELLRWDAAVWQQATIENRENKVCDLTDDQKSKLQSAEGIKLTLVRCGNMLYTLLNDEFVPSGTKALPSEYADGQVQVGLWAFTSNVDSVWKFDITAGIPSQIPTYNAPDFTVDNGTIEFDKASYRYGETATVTVTPSDNCILYTFTVCGEDASEQVKDNAYSFTVTKDITVQAVFAVVQTKEVSVTVSGLNKGETVQLSGTVTFTNTVDTADTKTVTIDNGTATVSLTTPGTYKVVSSDANYYDGTLTLAKGDTTATVTLQYKRFEAWAKNENSGNPDLTQTNGENPIIHTVDTGDLNVITKDTYGDVAVSVWLSNVNSAGNKGIVVQFENNKLMTLRIHKSGNEYWLCWNMKMDGWTVADKDLEWADTTNNGNGIWICALTTTQVDKLNSAEGIKLTVVRKDNKFYAFLDEEYTPGSGNYANNGTRTLSESDYSTGKVKVGFWSLGSVADKDWKFEISETLPALPA